MIRRILLAILLVLTFTVISTAQETETLTFTSEYVGNLIIEYPADWNAYDADSEFITTVARGDVSISNTLDAGQAALLFLTPQALEFSGLPATDPIRTLQALMGEMPPDTVESEIISEYGNGTQFKFSLDNEMSFIIGAFDRDGIPLIGIIGANDAPEGDVEALLTVMKTARYTEGAFENTSVLLSQRIVDATYGYTFFIPATWTQFDDFGFEVRGTFDTGTVLLLNQDTLGDEVNFDEINFETMIQGELDLLAPDEPDAVTVIIEEGDDINGYPTREVLMIREDVPEDGEPFEYLFVLVDFGNDQVLLSAMYSPLDIGTFDADDYLPTLRAIAESFFYGPFEPLDTPLDHAGLSIPYPSDYTSDLTDENQVILTQDEIQITINNPQKNLEIHGDIAEGDMSDFATHVASVNGLGEITVQLIPIGHPDPTRLFTAPLGQMDTLTIIFIESEIGIVTVTATYPDAVFEDTIQIIEGIASQLRISEE